LCIITNALLQPDTAMHILDTSLAQEIVARTMRIIPFNQH
jgi:hypothetical protein